jgi:hypothetical protein
LNRLVPGDRRGEMEAGGTGRIEAGAIRGGVSAVSGSGQAGLARLQTGKGG